MKKKYYKFISLITLFTLNINNVFGNSAQDSTLKAMRPVSNTLGIDWEWTTPLNKVFSTITDLIFNLLWIVAVWVFIYFWARLFLARWNQEEMKKVFIWFAYVVIWLAIISLSYLVISLVASLNF